MSDSASAPVAAPMRVAVIGTGVAGLAAAWLLDRRHDVTVYERAGRAGGHSNTAMVPDPPGPPVAVDTGFIVYNEENYPNLAALFGHLGVATKEACMSFAASIDAGRVEYAGKTLSSVFGRRLNAVSPRFWAMLADVARFHREARAYAGDPAFCTATLGDFMRARRYSSGFVEDFLTPMAAAIWSTPAVRVLEHPFRSFVEFYANHGLLQVLDLPVWRTVAGGAREYVRRMTENLRSPVRLDAGVRTIVRHADGVEVAEESGRRERYDHVVIATHADEALAMLEAPDVRERRLLGAFSYTRNCAVLHGDARLMPHRRRTWASWNYIGARRGDGEEAGASVTYWMNRLQSLECGRDIFVTINPIAPPREETIFGSYVYDHPVIDSCAHDARAQLWSLQGVRRTWYCGAHFGQGFHEDALQAGLAVAEALGGVRRPWRVDNESGRIALPAQTLQAAE